jgi:hypothetical protein
MSCGYNELKSRGCKKTPGVWENPRRNAPRRPYLPGCHPTPPGGSCSRHTRSCVKTPRANETRSLPRIPSVSVFAALTEPAQPAPSARMVVNTVTARPRRSTRRRKANLSLVGAQALKNCLGCLHILLRYTSLFSTRNFR